MDAKLANKLRGDGAKARAVGQSVFRNPLFDSDGFAANDESFKEWQTRAGAWLAGWEGEDNIRGPLADPLADQR